MFIEKVQIRRPVLIHWRNPVVRKRTPKSQLFAIMDPVDASLQGALYRDVTRTDVQAQSIPLRLEALAGVAQSFLEMGNHEQAFEISSFVLDQPSGTYETRDRASRIQCLARACLDAGEVRAMSEKLRGHTLESITGTLIGATQIEAGISGLTTV